MLFESNVNRRGPWLHILVFWPMVICFSGFEEDNWNGFKDLVSGHVSQRSQPQIRFLSDIGGQNKRTSMRCDNANQAMLLQRLKDQGDFNPTYMASNIDDAADHFQDLSDKHFIKSVSRYTCDQECIATREQLLGRLQTANKLPPADRVELRPDLGNMREEISPAVMNYARFQMMQQSRLFDQDFGRAQTQSFFGPLRGSVPLPSVSPFLRGKRDVAANDENDSTNIGSEIVLYCWKAGDEDGDKGLHKLCTACRSVRRLPDDYFPPFLNQVLCRGNMCLNGNGECVQQYISLGVLKNNGTKDCRNWVRHMISVPVCCDCMVKTSSSIYQLFVKPSDNSKI